MTEGTISPPPMDPAPASSEPVEDVDAVADPGGYPEGERVPELQALLASVEELRALLAPLSDEERRQVLELARGLRRRDRPAS